MKWTLVKPIHGNNLCNTCTVYETFAQIVNSSKQPWFISNPSPSSCKLHKSFNLLLGSIPTSQVPKLEMIMHKWISLILWILFFFSQCYFCLSSLVNSFLNSPKRRCVKRKIIWYLNSPSLKNSPTNKGKIKMGGGGNISLYTVGEGKEMRFICRSKYW